jgi:hypothetical protein
LAGVDPAFAGICGAGIDRAGVTAVHARVDGRRVSRASVGDASVVCVCARIRGAGVGAAAVRYSGQGSVGSVAVRGTHVARRRSAARYARVDHQSDPESANPTPHRAIA